MNLLIVDDLATNRKLLRVTLEAEGHTTLAAFAFPFVALIIAQPFKAG